LDAIDKVIWVCPFLAFLDVLSTFYVKSQGYSLELYGRGFFSSLFPREGSVYIYIYSAIYLLIMLGIAYALWYIKNKGLDPSRISDKVFLLALLGVVVYIYMSLTAAFAINFFLPAILERGTNVSWLTWVIYLSCILSLGIYLWQPVLSWVRPDDSKKKESN
jgi:predicted permease